MTTRKKISEAPSGEKTTLDGTELLPISGSQYITVASLADTIVTNNDEVIVHNGNVVTLG